MSQLLSVSDLRAKYKHEIQHTDHITALGLKIFDKTARHLQLDKQDRILLKAACELHDIGFSTNQREHAQASARIVLKEGLVGLDKDQTATVAGAILLHSRNHQKKKRDVIYKNLKDKQLANRIASILRIADGLDHGHIQNAVIERIRKTKGGIIIKVLSSGYPNNIPWAGGKADLWNSTFRVPVRILLEQDHPKKNSPRYYGIVHKDDSLISGARKLLMTQLRIIGDNLPGTIEGADPEHLHEFRVATRRFRSALRFFKSVLPHQGSRKTDQALAALASQLGNARDADVWMMFLKNAECSADADWTSYCDHQRKLRESYQHELARILESNSFWNFWEKANNYLRLELPALVTEEHQKGSFRVHCSKRLLKLNKELLSKKIKLTNMSPEKLHDFRKQCRKARYWAEFSAPALGASGRKYAMRLKELADDLGAVHDMDVHMELILNDKRFDLPVLNKTLQDIRTKKLEDAKKSWSRLTKKDFTTKLTESLKKIT